MQVTFRNNENQLFLPHGIKRISAFAKDLISDPFTDFQIIGVIDNSPNVDVINHHRIGFDPESLAWQKVSPKGEEENGAGTLTRTVDLHDVNVAL